MVEDFDTVTVNLAGGVTTVTLDRPEQKNAMNPKLHEEMCEVITAVKQDALDPEGGTRVLVLTGAGDSFCAGQDLEETFLDFEDDPWGAKQATALAMEWGKALWEFPSPTIAAVNGWVFGAGIRVLCSCDMAIASDKARFGLSEVNWGIFPAGGSTYVPSLVLGRRDFLYLSLSGEDIGAETANKMRLVNKVVPHDKLEAEVDELTKSICEINPLAVRYAKEAYLNQQQSDMGYDAAIDYELAKVGQLRQLQDAEDLRAVEAFKMGRFRPGLGSYDEEDIKEIK